MARSKRGADKNTPSREAFPERLARWHEEHPLRFVLGALLLAAVSLPLIFGFRGIVDGLTLNSDFQALLPESSQSVRDLDEIQSRFGGQQAMTLVLEAPNEAQLHAFTRQLARRVEGLREEKVVAIDWNVSDFATFVETNRHLYADIEDLTAIRDALQERMDYERERANPFFIDLDEEEPPDPSAVIQRIEREARQERDRAEERFPEGFLQHPDRTLVLMVIHTTVRGGDLNDTERLLASIDREIASLHPERTAPGLRVYRGGTLVDVRQETTELISAVRDATLLTIALVMVAIYVFFLRFRPIPLLSLALIPPVLVTFGVAELSVNYLNASSAFLSSIVVGNGINPKVIWLSRYFEERRAGKDVRASLIESHRGTWKGTLTASLAAGVAYGSLISTDFRGFRDFGLVGGSGMVFCWLAAYLLLPALTVLFERIRPLTFKPTSAKKGFYGVLFARVALRSSKSVLLVSLVITLVTGGLVAWAFANDPMEYDFRRLRAERDPDAENEQVLQFSQAIMTETLSGSALAVLAPSREEAQRFRRRLEENRDRFPRAYGEIRTIDDLLPKDQEAKLPLLSELRRLMLEIRPHVSADLQRLIDEQLPPENPVALQPDDLPRSVARPYTERDGTRGRLLFVESHPDFSSWDGVYLGRWAEAARSLRIEGTNRVPPVAGTGVVFSDLMQTVWRDGPRAVGVAFLATVILLILTFREQQHRWLTLVSLLVGIVWMAGSMAILGMRLNFLNFVAFPITFGNGVDYAVNVMRRYADEIERGQSRLVAVKESVEGTGGAVILCSLTTVIGYISLHTSRNQALNSFGAATAIGEVTCLIAAVLALPAALHLLAKRRASRARHSRDVRPSEV